MSCSLSQLSGGFLKWRGAYIGLVSSFDCFRTRPAKMKKFFKDLSKEIKELSVSSQPKAFSGAGRKLGSGSGTENDDQPRPRPLPTVSNIRMHLINCYHSGY